MSQPISINVNALINDFFNLFFQGLIIKVMMRVIPKEELEKELDEVNETTLKMFDGFFKTNSNVGSWCLS